MNKRYLTENVYDATQSRLRLLFEEFENLYVSFSGGKDSTVTADVVTKALSNPSLVHIFGDTTLEFPTTLEYKKRFNKNEESKGVRILTAKNREKT